MKTHKSVVVNCSVNQHFMKSRPRFERGVFFVLALYQGVPAARKGIVALFPGECFVDTCRTKRPGAVCPQRGKMLLFPDYFVSYRHKITTFVVQALEQKTSLQI